MADLFDRAEVTLHDKAACIRRELGYRRRVYPRWIDAGRMKPADADREIATMEAILADYAEGGRAR